MVGVHETDCLRIASATHAVVPLTAMAVPIVGGRRFLFPGRKGRKRPCREITCATDRLTFQGHGKKAEGDSRAGYGGLVWSGSAYSPEIAGQCFSFCTDSTAIGGYSAERQQ